MSDNVQHQKGRHEKCGKTETTGPTDVAQKIHECISIHLPPFEILYSHTCCFNCNLTTHNPGWPTESQSSAMLVTDSVSWNSSSCSRSISISSSHCSCCCHCGPSLHWCKQQIHLRPTKHNQLIPRHKQGQWPFHQAFILTKAFMYPQHWCCAKDN